MQSSPSQDFGTCLVNAVGAQSIDVPMSHMGELPTSVADFNTTSTYGSQVDTHNKTFLVHLTDFTAEENNVPGKTLVCLEASQEHEKMGHFVSTFFTNDGSVRQCDDSRPDFVIEVSLQDFMASVAQQGRFEYFQTMGGDAGKQAFTNNSTDEAYNLLGAGATVRGHSPLDNESVVYTSVCLLVSLGHAGFDIDFDAVGDGPFSVLADGNRILAPHGHMMTPVPNNTVLSQGRHLVTFERNSETCCFLVETGACMR
jgi:hypothetical protein